MSILDLGFKSKEELIAGIETAAPIIAETLQKSGLADETFVKLLQEGLSPADILDLSRDHLDALFAAGVSYMGAGQVQNARDVFQTLSQLQPLDERFTFALAATFQVEGDYAMAGKLYVYFLALDALNVDGYLRLGECLLGAHEYDEALDVFETALALCKKGHGDDAASSHAEAMITHITELKTANPAAS